MCEKFASLILEIFPEWIQTRNEFSHLIFKIFATAILQIENFSKKSPFERMYLRQSFLGF